MNCLIRAQGRAGRMPRPSRLSGVVCHEKPKAAPGFGPSRLVAPGVSSGRHDGRARPDARGLCSPCGRAARDASPTGAGGDPALALGRAEPPRHLRHEARRPGRVPRAVRADRDGGPRAARLRAAARPGPPRRQVRAAAGHAPRVERPRRRRDDRPDREHRRGGRAGRRGEHQGACGRAPARSSAGCTGASRARSLRTSSSATRSTRG